MFLAVLILSGIFNDIQAHYANESDTVLHDIHKRQLGGGQGLCQGMSVTQCARSSPQLVRQCKVCGLHNMATRGIRSAAKLVIKGESVNPPYKYPFMAVLIKGREKTCGGAILSDRYILTAAHCVSKIAPGNKENPQFERFFRPNELKIGFVTKSNKIIFGPPLAKIIPHPGFRLEHMMYDIALLKLSHKNTCNMLRNPICLPTSLGRLTFRRFKNKQFQIAGWGDVHEAPKIMANSLKEGTVRMVSPSVCMPHINNPEAKKIFASRPVAFCVQGVNGKRPCFGDSGGPLFARFKGRFIAIGITSFHTCKLCRNHKPAIYTNIQVFLPWIMKNMFSSRSNVRYLKRKSGGYLSMKSTVKQTKKTCKKKYFP